MGRLDGWKMIAAYLRRDERTARRWAAESGLPVHRIPGSGRGSVYALAEEIDSWLKADRTRFEAERSTLVVIETIRPTMVRTVPVPWWRRRWIAGALIASGTLFVSAGMLTLHWSRAASQVVQPEFADPATKEMFLQASYDWNLRTANSLAQAVREYSDVIGRDPRVPAAYVGLANSYLLLREYSSLPDAAAYPRAEAAAQAALTLAPDCAEAHRALAFIAFWWRQDHVAARDEFKRALTLKPDDPLTHHWFATALLANAEPQAALREIDRARNLDPFATATIIDRATILYYAGHHTEGLATLHNLVRQQPDNVGIHRTLAEIALFEGRPDEFLRETAMTARLRSDAVGAAEAERWRSAGPDMQAIIAMMLGDATKAEKDWFRIAKLEALSGQRDKAKDALGRACEAHEPDTVYALSSLWLSHALSTNDIIELCGRAIPL
jgi:tetratricopeptide (TPR) repeat protein